MNSPHPRPLSPHLTVWKWGPGMLVSILHRLTGGALTVVGLAILTWWLISLSGGTETYASFVKFINWEWSSIPFVLIALALLTWAFWQHFFSGLRHLVLDTGAGYELKVNRFWSVMTLALSLLATALTWYYLLGVGQ